MRLRLAAALLAASLTSAAAEGPGQYAVSGQDPDGSSYQGSATITQTAKDIWRIAWVIGDERYEGFAIGDGKVLSVMFTSKEGSGVALYVSDDKGDYNGRWAFRGASAVGSEKLSTR